MKTSIFYALAFCILAGCSSTEYRIVAPRPQLTLSTNSATCEFGKTVNLTLTATQEGEDGDLTLCALTRQGEARITLDGTDINTSGQWVQLTGRSVRLIITPTQTTDLLISFQIRSSSGETSDQQNLAITVTGPSELSAEASCDAKIINPAADIQIPVTLNIQGASTDGTFTVTPSIELGKGKIYLDGYVVNDTACTVGGNTVFKYAPEEIGEHIIEFQIASGAESLNARAYMNIVKDITVSSIVDGCFSIDGTGEHDIEGEEITLKLVNEELFNFEPAGWYDNTGRLLSETETYTVKLSLKCPTTFEVRLKPRTVTITGEGITQVPFQYLVMENGRPVSKVAYDYRTRYTTDYKTSERIKLYYEEYRLDKGKLPPTPTKSAETPSWAKGATKSDFLWRYDKKFSVYLRASDNPGFRFNYALRYIESESTRYYIPVDITMLN